MMVAVEFSGYSLWGVYPGTGAWTGILAASILRMDFKKSIMACLCGIMLAGVIMAISSIGVLNLLDIN